MSTKALVDKIESLPPDKKAEVEDLVDHLVAVDREDAASSRAELIARIETRRERLLKERGLFDTLPLIHEFRETGR